MDRRDHLKIVDNSSTDAGREETIVNERRQNQAIREEIKRRSEETDRELANLEKRKQEVLGD